MGTFAFTGSVCYIAWSQSGRFWYYDAAMSCAARGHRLCWSDEMTVIHEHRLFRSTAGYGMLWLDGGEGNDNHEESGWNSDDGHLEDWNSAGDGRNNHRGNFACCRTIGFFDGEKGSPISFANAASNTL